jgi:hypothetical protein
MAIVGIPVVDVKSVLCVKITNICAVGAYEYKYLSALYTHILTEKLL